MNKNPTGTVEGKWYEATMVSFVRSIPKAIPIPGLCDPCHGPTRTAKNICGRVTAQPHGIGVTNDIIWTGRVLMGRCVNTRVYL